MPSFFRHFFLLLPIIFSPVLALPATARAAAFQPQTYAISPPATPNDDQPRHPPSISHPLATPSTVYDSQNCDYDSLVGQTFKEADLSVIKTPFRISYTHAPPIAFVTPRVTVLVDLGTDRILGVHCPTRKPQASR